ncbi:MBL fold metallo-hydrolase [Fulvitalea axinellae]|uniref:MBL fold metallo-hydrolase n=2 Tax=Fulvitalea axinellae TaxID=1182444 RepID=A0AAU9CZ95_9BACT|nr:MBL fold metallo-hydrolase [Fulvitalea axinellae]
MVQAGQFYLDGGAMFGVVPKTIWSKTNEADEKNRILLSCRCLLVETDDRKILIDTGLGDKQTAKFFGFYDWDVNNDIREKVREAGVDPEDITDVFFTHLHFDHCGGAVVAGEGGEPGLAFPKATHWSHSKHWHWAVYPNAREKASFLKENILPIEASGKLKFADKGHDLPFEFVEVCGHTQSQMLPLIEVGGKKVLYAADLLPTAGHVPLPYVMGYDVNPLKTLEEKKKWLEWVEKENVILFLEHDAQYDCCTLKSTEKGPRVDRLMSLEEALEA